MRIKLRDEVQYQRAKHQVEADKQLIATKANNITDEQYHRMLKNRIQMYEDAIKEYEHRNDKWEQHG